MAKGWWFPTNSRKAHYFDNEFRSLCGNWGKMSSDELDPLEDNNHGSVDNCKVCARKREKLYGAKEGAKDGE